MDTAYGKLELPFRQALYVLATVISASPSGYFVADCGLKALGMDHGKPDLEGGGEVLIVSDEHLTVVPANPHKVGDRVRVIPAHVDPTVAYHQRMHLVRGDEVLETWEVDLRGW
jgi:D-serine deaminase-like pyridoxal phosphate-dependent protein